MWGLAKRGELKKKEIKDENRIAEKVFLGE